jgi:lactoylglutathione lyase
MSQGVFFRAVGPIGDTDPGALPVKELGPSVGYYTQCLGFAVVAKGTTTARLKRDDVEIGLAVNGRDPEQASCWFSVGDVEALWREFEARGIGPGIIDEQTYDGKPYRVFFAKDPYGVCFCFTQPLDRAEDLVPIASLG